MQSVKQVDRSLTLVTVNDDNRYLLNRFYKHNGHKGKATHTDHAFYLSQQDKILAAVRFEITPDYMLMRGLWVEKNSRGQGLGSNLLKQLIQQMKQQPCYCLPYKEQRQFYLQQFFIDASADAPSQLIQQWQHYQQRGELLDLMRYQPPCDCLI